MNTFKSQSRLKFISLLLGMSLFITGCVGTRIGVDWPAIALINYNGQDKIMVAFNQRVSMIEPSNGQRTALVNTEGQVRVDEQGNPRPWQVEGSTFENAQFYAIPSVSDDGETLYLPAYNSRILTIDLLTATATSNLGFSLDDAVIDSAVQSDTMYFVPLQTTGIVALDRETFNVAWNFAAQEGVWTSPLLADDVLYVPALNHSLYALDATSGTLLWELDLEGALSSTPLLYEDHLYIGSFSHVLYKISLDGEIVDSYTSRNWIWSTPALFAETLYISDLSGYIHAVDPVTMTEIWSVRPAERGVRAAPVVTEQYVIAASRDGRVYWLDRGTGELVFSREIEGRPEILSDILLVERDPDSGIPESLIVVGTSDPGRMIAAFTLENGRASWVYGR